MKPLAWHTLAEFAAIAVCSSSGDWRRLGKNAFRTILGLTSYKVFASALTRIDSEAAG